MSPAKKSKSQSVLTGGLPQVNLLPPEIHAARGLRVVKRWLGIALLVVLVVIAGLYAWAMLAKQDAENDLALAEDETARLIAEQAKYAEVPAVLAELANSEDSLWLATSTEVLWEPYLRAIASTVPNDVSIDSLGYAGMTPLAPDAYLTSPLQKPGVGSITFTARSLTVPDTAEWIEKLNAVPGFSDAWFSDASTTEEEEEVFYVVNATVQVTEPAWAQRFVPESAKPKPAAEQPAQEQTEGEG